MNKQRIATAIKFEMQRQGYSLRSLAAVIDGMSYTQIARMTSSNDNYTIDNLIKVLSALGLSISIIKEEN
jgi:transcriptional regulator with XRE-family HTH domain